MGLARALGPSYPPTMIVGRLMAVGALLIVGCGGTVKGESGSELGAHRAEGPSGSGGAAMKAMPTMPAAPTSSQHSGNAPPLDAGHAVIEPGPLVECLHGDAGPAAPEQFVRLNHQQQVCNGPGNDCVDFFEIRADCGLTFQSNNQSRDAVADAADCAALARFATSRFLAAGLDDTTTCLPGPGNPAESTELELATGPGPRKKTSLCEMEPFVSLRACVVTVTTKYFPTMR